MKENDFNIRIAGEAGYGIASAGLALAKIALRSGYFVFDYSEYPSLIRGGHNIYTLRISGEQIYSPSLPVDFLIALNQDAVDFNKDQLSPQSFILLNSDKASDSGLSSGIRALPIPLVKIALDNKGSEVMMNNVALGAITFLLKAEFSVLESGIREAFSWATSEIIDLNIKVAQKGFDYAKDNFAAEEIKFDLKKIKAKPRLLLTGNDAFGLGAIKAGCKFFAAYPMTPINSLIVYFAAKAKELNLVYFQPEDEIAAINSALGAAVCGVRSMTASSGGGFSLMVEALGMAGMTETPLVIIEGQRPGPSSGMPTWTGQGDLRFVLHASQDDFPRIVLAPGDVEECFWLMIDAFNLAEKYQLPVIVLTDKYLAESRQSINLIDDSKVEIERGKIVSLKDSLQDYHRYEFAQDGVSPRAFIGQTKEPFFTTSYEHNEAGFAAEDIETRKAMMEKRMKKLETLEKEMSQPIIYGSKDAEFGFISWGSNKGIILEAQKILASQRIKTSFLHLNFLNPFPAEAVAEFCQDKQVLLLEQNISGQLAGLIREKTGLKIKDQFLKYDGRPFYPEEIADKVKQIL
ncbi:2-oxoacid:acceptor oxidoreductase subunit alpha [Patescibacteria group bacterium]|nr:2-oxoacid:acceptor oxidoreductase subunit alpha [Patescibacteria group bacterium]MBU4467001.1 2-oxoacid:acceptor oxidoreductase subunit alpha [Patescibacteria group bacterium]